MTGVHPCTLLTPAERTRLDPKLDTGSEGQADQFGSLDCQWTNGGGPPDSRWLARLILRQPADYALDSTQPTQIVTIDGFAAVQTASPQQELQDHCLVLVDVAQGETLWTQYLNLAGDYPGITHEKACELTRTFAGMVVNNLRAARGK